MQPVTPMPLSAHRPEPPDPDAQLHAVARKLESQFLSEMLRHAGLGATETEFSGGIGEEQFGSFLREQQAVGMVRAGGIGLAESIYHALKARL